jgi:hypothetical protein
MKDPKVRPYDLGKSGEITMHLDGERKWLLIEFRTDAKGLDKTGVSRLIDALRDMRDRMDR